MIETVANIVSPASTEEVLDALRLARDHGMLVHPCGSGSKFSWLSEAPEGMFLRMSRMDAVLEHTWQDMTCTVQAGCTWQALQDALSRHGQQVALDALWPDRATVGGIIAANDSGALRLRYGSLRDLVIGMTVVLADGTVARSGGKVVKNVAGYDLPKLFCGSFGTLGIITEVTFRLHSVKQSRLTLTASAGSVEPLGKLMLGVLASHLNPEAMQLRTSPKGSALDVRLAAQPDVLDMQSAELRAMTDCAVEQAEAYGAEVWLAREAIFSDRAKDNPVNGTSEPNADSFLFKATMLPAKLAEFLQGLSALGGEAVAQATGVVTGRIALELEEDLRRLRFQVETGSGSLTVLRLPSSSTLDRWGSLPSSLPLMRAVKKSFDPSGLLNPGLFLGGI